MEFLDLYLLAFFGGTLFLINGFRKRLRKDVFLHGSLSEVMMGVASLIPLIYGAEQLLEFDLDLSQNLLVITVITGVVVSMLYKIRYEMTHKKVNIHNLPTDEVINIIKKQLEQHKVEYTYEKPAGRQLLFTFPEEKGKITVESHYITDAHQIVTFKKTNHIPRFDDVFEGLKEESENKERPISKTLGMLDILFGSSLIIFGIYALQMFS